MDWKPVPSIPEHFAIDHGKMSEAALKKLKAYARDEGIGDRWIDERIDSVYFAARTDGLFLFSVVYKQPLAEIDEINVSCMVSSFLKEEMGHVHHFNRKSIYRFFTSNVNVLHKSPVRIFHSLSGDLTSLPDDFSGETLAKLIETNSLVHALNPDDWPKTTFKFGHRLYAERKSKERPAIAVLRHQYDSLFSKTLRWIHQFKRPKEIFGVRFRRRAWTYQITFFLVVFGIAVYSTDPGFDVSKVSIQWMIMYGLFSAACWILFIAAILKILSAMIEKIPSQWMNYFDDVGSTRRLVRKGVLKAVNIFNLLPDFFFILIFAGVVLFPIKEVPAPEPLAKLVNAAASMFFDTKRFFEAYSNLASFGSASQTGLFWGVFLERVLLLAPAFIALIYWWEILFWRQKIEKSLRNLLGHLRYAGILDDLCRDVCAKSSEVLSPRSGYSQATQIIDDRLKVEIAKRRTIQGALILAMVLIFSVWIVRYDSSTVNPMRVSMESFEENDSRSLLPGSEVTGQSETSQFPFAAESAQVSPVSPKSN